MFAIHHVIFDEFPVALFYASQARTRFGAKDAIYKVADRVRFTFENGLEADAFVGVGSGNIREVAKGSEGIEKIGVSGGSRAGFDAGALYYEGHAPAVFVEVLFALQAMSPDCDAVIGRVDYVSVLEFAHRFEFVENAADLNIDIFTTGEFPTEFVSNGSFVTIFPDTAYAFFVSSSWEAKREWVSRKIVRRKLGLFEVFQWQRVGVGVIYGAVFREEFRFAVSRVVRMGEPKIDQEWIGVLV